jgi:hypothetical protein
MKKRIKRFFKRLKLRMYLYFKKIGFAPTHQDDPTTYEKTCFLICLKVIQHPDTKFMIAPMSNKRYLENKEIDIFITMDYGRIDLTNHVYHYSVKLNNRDWERITKIFDTETEKRRLKYEDTINSQIKNSLHNVLEKVSKSINQ